MTLASERGDRGRFAATGAALITLALVALAVFAGRAQAAEFIYWDNYNANSIAFAEITGSGGGPLNLTAAELKGPEGMAYDSATGRIFVAGYESGPDKKGQIIWVNVDGSGAGVLNTTGAPVEEPMGVAIDPATRTIYWTNTEAPGEAEGSIGWANLDGTGGGQLNTTGVVLDGPYKIGLDPVGGRVFWSNGGATPENIGYANVNNTGGGILDVSGATPPSGINGFAVDSVAGRIYWQDGNGVSSASLAGGGGADLDITGAVYNGPYGMAVDPSLSRVYWGNYSNGETRANAIGFASLLGGGGGGISPVTAPVAGPQDPVIVKSPTGTGAPTITRNPKNRAQLTCSTGNWAADFAGGFVYQSPRTIGHQWLRNGSPIGGATAATFDAKSPGNYSCTVTAANHVGSAAQTSAATKVKAAKIKLTTKKKATAEPGDLVTFKVKAVNQGDIKSKNAKVCVKLPNAAKDDLKKPKCKALGKVKGQGKDSATVKIKVKPGADEGVDKVTFQVKGAPGKAAKSRIIVE